MFQNYNFYVVGDTPLLMNNPRGMWVSQKGGKGKRFVPPPPEEEAETAAYKDEDGNLVFPAQGFRKAFLRAMVGYKIGRRALKSYLNHVRTKTEWFLLLDPESKEILKNYKIDTRRVVIQGSAIMRSRAMVEKWATQVTFIMNEEIAQMSTSDLLEKAEALLNEAGQTVGVGDFRLEKGGWFGMFHVEKSWIE